MTYIEMILKPAFDVLNFSLKVPIDFNGHFIEFRLYYVFILLFVIEIIKVVWDSLTKSSSN